MLIVLAVLVLLGESVSSISCVKEEAKKEITYEEKCIPCHNCLHAPCHMIHLKLHLKDDDQRGQINELLVHQNYISFYRDIFPLPGAVVADVFPEDISSDEKDRSSIEICISV